MQQGTVRTRREIETELRKLLEALKEYEDDIRGWRRQLLLEVIALNTAELVDVPPHREGELVLISTPPVDASKVPADVDEYPVIVASNN